MEDVLLPLFIVSIVSSLVYVLVLRSRFSSDIDINNIDPSKDEYIFYTTPLIIFALHFIAIITVIVLLLNYSKENDYMYILYVSLIITVAVIHSIKFIKPQLIIDSAGIYAPGNLSIIWEDIDRISRSSIVVASTYISNINIFVKDGDKYYQKLSVLKKINRILDLNFSKNKYKINTTHLNINTGKLIAIINKYI
jgi:hypothetical protein